MKAFNYYLKVLKNYAVFDGRARRSEYWYFVLFNMIASVITTGIDSVIGTGGILNMIYSLGVLVPSIAVGVRRMHDVGKSGWFLLIPFYNLYLAVTDGEAGANTYGPNPKTGEMETIDHLVE